MEGSKSSFARWILSLLIMAGPAHGDAGAVLSVSLRQTFGYDSNLFKLAPEADALAIIGSADRADLYSASTLRLAVDKRLGRQKLHAAAGLTQKRHDRFARLDSTLRDHSLGWDWQSGHLWSGSLTASRSQMVPGFDEFQATVRDIVTVDAATARATLLLHPDWRVIIGIATRRVGHSAQANAYGDSRVDSAEGGLRYGPGTGKEFGLRIRQSEAAYATPQPVNGILVNNGYRESGLDFDAAWPTGGTSRLRAALGWVERRHRELAARDHAGRTGSLGWDWTPTGKTSLGFSLRQEISAQSDLLATYATVQAAGFSAGWRPTAKLALQGVLDCRRRTMSGDPAAILTGQTPRQDDERTLSINLDYAAMRDLQLQASWRAASRDSNAAGYSYVARQMFLSANLTF
jgi:exopolysaccharide biosynthesis operon protein EpsL